MRRFAGDRSGNFGMIGALLLPVGLSLAAVAVDHGSLYFERRETQAVADLTAIAAAARIGDADATALAMLAANGISGARLMPALDTQGIRSTGPQLVVATGRYEPGAAEVGERFRAGETPANAVEITIARGGTRHFAAGLFETPVIVTTAVAAAPAAAALSVGSRLASLDGGLLNALLGQMLGAELALEVMDYEALLDAHVDLPDLLDGLAAEAGVSAATYDEVLAADFTQAQLAETLAAVDGLDARSRAALNVIARESGDHAFPLSKLISLGSAGALPLGQAASGLSAEIGVMELISAATVAANDGAQLALDLGASIPGLLDVAADLAIGQPPQGGTWFAFGETGAIVRTAQTRLSLVAEIGGGLLGTKLRLPIYLELAFAEAELASVSCPTGRPDSARVEVSARPGVVEAWIGEVSGISDFSRAASVAPATILDTPLLAVTGQAHAEATNAATDTLSFDADDIEALRVQSVATRDFSETLAGSLIGELQLQARVKGLGLGLPSDVPGLVASLVQPVAPALDTLIANLLAVLGLKIGEADVRVHAVSCGRSVLVQ